MQVLRKLFRLNGIFEYKQILEYLTSKRQNHVKEQAEPSDTQAVEITSLTVSISEHRHTTLGIVSKEASGYAMLFTSEKCMDGGYIIHRDTLFTVRKTTSRTQVVPH